MRRLFAIALVGFALVVLMGCSDRQVQLWLAWWNDDPAAAEAHLSEPWVQVQLSQRESPQPPSGGSRWDRIARCESGGRWDYPIVTNRTGSYSGGLMIWTKAWAAYGGHEFAPNAYQASKAEQIVVAERILADQGWGAWDCS